MNKVLKIILVVALLVAVLLSGCSLSASKRPAGDPTATSELQFMTETPGGDGLADDIAKQTQAALQPAVVTETPVPAVDEPAQPAPEATQAPAPEQEQPQEQQQQQQQQQAVSVPTLERPSTYTLQKGEFPFCIARRYDLNVATLLSANGMTLNSKPGVGTVLKIPSGGSYDGERALRPHTDYKVGSGDTIYSIACYFGDVSPEAIIAVNGLSGPGDVTAGMTLKIP